MNRPRPTPIFRLLHIDSLATVVQRGALHAPNCIPDDGLPFLSIHRRDVQSSRRPSLVPCCRRGSVGDYVSFYLGPRSPMLYQLKTGWVPHYTGGQEPLVYLVGSIEAIQAASQSFAFTDRHSLATYAKWSDNAKDLDGLDWDTIYATSWCKTVDDPERQNRKQAEFLVHRAVGLDLFDRVGVISAGVASRVGDLLARHSKWHHLRVEVAPQWYY